MNYSIPRRKFGRTGLEISIISLGGGPIGSNNNRFLYGRTVDDKTAIKTVEAALERGINYIDTSPFYGESERRIGRALKGVDRNSFFLSTKAGTHPVFKGYSAEKFRRSVEASLETLGVDYFDVLNIHDPEEKDFEEVMNEGGALEEMFKMREKGIIKFFGLGVRSHQLHKRFIESGNADVILTWLDYNLLRQSAGDLLNLCKERNVGQ